jgi:FAD/FMN-containing dehydrogenase
LTLLCEKGHAAFGGFGPFSRVAGLLHDRITAAEVVLANGTLTTASAKKNPSLFWALRGAGASYGIVTEWTYATLAAPPSVISYKIDYTATPLSASQAQDLVEKWQSIALSAPDNLSVICTVAGYNYTLLLEASTCLVLNY